MGITGFADDKGTVVTASAKIRQSADASSEQIGSVALGGNVDIIAQTTGTDGNTWYQVYVDANTKGYIRADLVKAEGTGTISKITSGSATTTTTASTTTDQSETQVTAVDAKKCTVSQNSVRIRKGASTNHDIVATANRGMTLTITGEATGSDGKTWYQVTFTYNNSEITGFIRSDLVTFDDVSDDAATSQITGEGTETTTEAETESIAETEEETQEEEENSSQGIVLMNVDETPYILPGFSSVSLSWNDESIQAYSNGGFYLFYARMENGDEGWYIFDSEKGEYQRYVYTASSTATVPSNSNGVGLVPVIILIIIIIIMAAVIGLLFIKLRDLSNYDEYDDYRYDDDDSDDLEFEEIGARHQTTQARRTQQSMQSVQGTSQSGQARRTQQSMQSIQGTSQSGQARQNGQVRRTQQSAQGTSQSGQARQNGQARRTQQSAQGTSQSGQARQNGQVRRTTQQSSQATGQNGQVRRTQQRPATNHNANGVQQGYKAKTILENQDDDMEFIDI
jgi:hypothetical protein